MKPRDCAREAKKQSVAKKELMQIGAAAKKAGVSRQSVQYYLMLGLVEPTQVTAGGHRLFDDAAVDRIKLIRSLNKSGYTLRGIRELFEGRLSKKGTEHG